MHDEQTLEVQITAIHDIEAAAFYGQKIQHADLIELGIADVDKGRNGAAQVQQRMQLDGGTLGINGGPIKETQAKLDGGGIEGVDARIEIQHRLIAIKATGATDKPKRNRLIDTPVTMVQSIGQRGTSRWLRQAHMKQLALIGRQASLNIPQ